MFQASATLKPGRSVGEHGVFQPRGGPSFFHGLLGAAPAPRLSHPKGIRNWLRFARTRIPFAPLAASGIPLKLASFGQHPNPLCLRHLLSQIGFVWEIAISPAQLASFRTPRGTDLPFCPRPARRPVPLGVPSPSSDWLRFAQGPHLTCHLLYLGLKLIRDARILLTSTVRIGYIHAGRASNYPAGLNE